MHFSKALLPLSYLAITGNAYPFERRTTINNDILIFDAPAFPDPSNAANTLVQIQDFISLRALNIDLVLKAIESGINGLGIDIGDKLSTLQNRIKLLAAIGDSGEDVTLSISGCSREVTLPESSGLPDLGMALGTVSAGTCNGSELNAQVKASFLDNRDTTATVFNSQNSGFGVISDIDDTVKISHTLDKVALVKSALLDDPEPVSGMPELYSSLVRSLNKPDFFYISASPWQLYPFLRDFIHTTYSASKGPVFLQNLTVVDIPNVIDFLSNKNILEYKLQQIDRIMGMYPNKKFLCVGDSTQKDPETYAAAFKKYGDAVSCAWIRRVDGADNSDARFAAAFAGMPQTRFRIFDDSEIPSLANINVAGGEC